MSAFSKKNRKGKKKWFIAAIIFILFIIIGNVAAPESTNKANTENKSVATSSNTTKDNKDNAVKTSESASSTNVNAETKTTGTLKVHYIDVGQADSILVQQNGQNMLIDAGNNEDSDLVVNYLKSQGVSKLNYVIGTHPHEDHIGGLDVVIKTFDIGKIYMPKATSTTATFKDVISAISTKGLKITTPTVGEIFNLGDATATILAPNGSGYDDANNYSIVIKLTYGNNSFLFMGDAEDVSENEILSNGQDIKADVLKVGHHGSRSSTTQEFLNKVSPKYAVISVGQGNEYGHPHKSTMDKLKAKGIVVYRTDETGTIVATSDGSNITFSAKPGTYSSRGNGSSNSNNSGSSSSSNKTSSSSSAGSKVSNSKTSSSSSKNSSSKTTVVPVQKTTTKSSTQTSNNNTSNNTRTVYYTPKGKSYHYSKSCRTLSRSKTILSGTLSEAINSGHADPCDVCTK